MLNKKDILKMSDGYAIKTVALIKSYDSRPTKNGGKYMDGTLEMQGSVPFKVWAGKLYDELDACEYRGVICQIEGKVNEYNGTTSIILSDVKALEEGTYDESDFFEVKYNKEQYKEALDSFIEKRCSAEAQKIYMMVMNKIQDRFTVEFAAKGHHDAVKSGLLAHTYKVALIMARTIKIYGHIMNKVDSDLIYLGCVLHDIGKIHEYTNGAVVGNGLLVSHHTFGVEIISEFKKEILELKGEEFYYRLLAIIEQHHGEFEERPRTLEAYLVHIADLLESRMQIIDEAIEKDLNPVNIDGFKLN